MKINIKKHSFVSITNIWVHNGFLYDLNVEHMLRQVERLDVETKPRPAHQGLFLGCSHQTVAVVGYRVLTTLVQRSLTRCGNLGII